MHSYGDIQCLENISSFSKLAKNSVENLKAITEKISHENIHIDMTDFPGFNYHQGLVFSVHSQNFGFAIANGGQYSYQKNSKNGLFFACPFGDVCFICEIRVNNL